MKACDRSLSPMLFVVLIALFLSTACKPSPQSPSPVKVTEFTADADAAATLPAIDLAEGDWPGWRGPDASGHAAEQAIPLEWDSATNVVWTADVPGRGHASPVVVGDAIYLASALDSSQQQVVISYDRATGDERWQKTIHKGNFTKRVHQKATHANSTVACDGERVFAAFLNSDRVYVTALDLEGNQLWQQEVGGFGSQFGYAPSPVLFQDYVIVAADNWSGGYLAALRRDSGEVAWRKARPAISSYSSPRIAHVGGKQQLLITGCNKLASFDPATGESNWSCDAVAETTCGTVVTDGELIFASGGYPEQQTVCVDSEGNQVWEQSVKVYEPSLLLAGDHLFAIDDKGVARCWEKATGKEAWKARVGGSYSASPVLCGKHIFAPNLSGETVVFEASPEGFRETARNKLGDDAYASLAVSNGQIFLRAGHGSGGQRKEKLHCIAKQ